MPTAKPLKPHWDKKNGKWHVKCGASGKIKLAKPEQLLR